MTERRLRQANLIGPAGYISMEDGAAPGFVQRGVARGREFVGGGNGRRERRLRRQPRNRSRRARLLEGLPHAYGIVSCPSTCSCTVQDLNARYGHAIDDDKLEAWPEFFTEQGRYRITTAENVARGLPLGLIYATSRAMLRDRVRSLREANVYEAQRYRHVHRPAAGRGRRTRASCEAQTSFMVARIMHTGETMLFATGRYQDRIVLDADAGEPRFPEKIVILDSRLIDTLLAIPL